MSEQSLNRFQFQKDRIIQKSDPANRVRYISKRMGSSRIQDEIINLAQLPFDALEKIGDNLDRESSLNLRLTCSVLNKLIDTYVGVHFKIDGHPSRVYTHEQLNFVSEVCLRKLTLNHILRNFDGNEGLRSFFNRKKCLLFGDIFCFPHFLRKIKFKGLTYANFLFQMLTKCRNLEEVFLEGEFQIQGDLWPFLIMDEYQKVFSSEWNQRSLWLSALSQEDIFNRIKLTRLRRIYFDFHSSDEKGSDVVNAMILLKCIQSKAMERIALNLSHINGLTEIEYFHVSNIIADFIEAHVETLKDFTLYINPTSSSFGPVLSNSGYQELLSQTFQVQTEPDSIKDEDLRHQKIRMMITLRRKLDRIGKISKLTYFNIAVLPKFHWDFWLVFIENLRKLTTLQIFGSTKYSILQNCGFTTNFCKTLKRFRMTLDIVEVLDLSGIEECDNLEEFYLYNRPEIFCLLSGFNHGVINLKNVQLLPPGLKALCLGDVSVASEEFNEMLSIQKTLDTLVIINMWSHNPNNGVDCEGLKKIFHMRALQSCLIFGFRCHDVINFGTLIELLQFSLNENDNDYLSEMYKVMEFNRAIPLVMCFDIVSTAVFPRYIWKKEPVGNSHIMISGFYSVRYNELDPYL